MPSLDTTTIRRSTGVSITYPVDPLPGDTNTAVAYAFFKQSLSQSDELADIKLGSEGSTYSGVTLEAGEGTFNVLLEILPSDIPEFVDGESIFRFYFFEIILRSESEKPIFIDSGRVCVELGAIRAV